MKHTIRHGLSKDRAKKVLDKAADAYRQRFEKYDPQVEWVSDDQMSLSFSAKGVSVDGNLEVLDDEIAVDLDVPFVLKMFKGKAISVIEEEVDKWVAKAKAGELDDDDTAQA